MADAENDSYIYWMNPGRFDGPHGAGTVDIHGEALDEELWVKYASEIREVSFGVSSSGKSGNTATADKIEFDKVTIQKYTEWATAHYLKALVTGSEFDECTIEMRTNMRKYLEITLYKAVVTNVSFNQSGSDMPVDTIQIQFKAFRWNYIGDEPPEDLEFDPSWCEYTLTQHDMSTDTTPR